MRKFVASAAALVLAAFVTLFGVVAPTQAIGSAITATPSALSMNANTSVSPDFTVTFTRTVTSLGATGSVLVGLTEVTPAHPNDCTGVTASFSSSQCSVVTAGNLHTWIFDGIDMSGPASAYTVTFASGSFTTQTSNVLLTVDVSGSNDHTVPAANHDLKTIVVSSPSPSPTPTPSPSQTQQQQQQMNQVSLSFASAGHALASSIDGLSNGDNFPGYTTTFTGIGGGTYDSFNLVVGDINNGNFYVVPGAASNNWSTGSAPWSPNANNCGVTNIIRGGVALTASSGVSCMKMTGVFNGQTQYWVRVELGSASSDDITYTVAPGTFVIANKSSNDQFASFLLRNDTNTNTNYSARKFQLLNATNVGGIGSSGASDSIADFTLPSGIGQPVAGQTVGIAASNLALNTNYSVVLRSTPQILEQGTTTATFMNTTVTIPAGLEPGWHSITFSAVRSDGVSTEQVAYFKISESGILLSTSTVIPAELAFTAAPKGDQWGLGFLIAILGIGLITAAYTYRRRVFEMVYVMTGQGSNLDIELVEQPKKARYLPMRKL